MARSKQEATEGRALAARITAAKRRGMTNAEIGRIYGINERTVRKIRSGETTGRVTYRRLTGKARGEPEGENLSMSRLVLDLGDDENGNPVYASVNGKLPVLRSARGRDTRFTLADLILYPNVEGIIAAEIARQEQRYANVVRSGRGRIVAIMPAQRRTKPLRIAVEGRYVP